jgi:hypothetical protein
MGITHERILGSSEFAGIIGFTGFTGLGGLGDYISRIDQ